MTFDEKSGREPLSDRFRTVRHLSSSAAVTGELSQPANKANICTFSDVVEKACEGLMNQQNKNTIRRIYEMQERLCELEQELDTFLLQKSTKQGSSKKIDRKMR
jgi:C4-dicarboxylate-specific signal transduction histidine kinase